MDEDEVNLVERALSNVTTAKNLGIKNLNAGQKRRMSRNMPTILILCVEFIRVRM